MSLQAGRETSGIVSHHGSDSNLESADFATHSSTTKSPTTDNRIGVQFGKEIDRDRAGLLSYLVKLNKCIDARHTDLTQALTHRFNELLIDYLSYGHFKLLEAHTPQSHQMAALDNLTQAAIQFNDRYSDFGNQPIPLKSLKADLERLALSLEVRFEIEDEILELV